jgi:acyl-CoA synthetase (AMP-forming)/AMP-acid ligase II
VSPRRVEAVVHELDGVCEAAAVGVAHEVLGHVLRLAVVVEQGSTLTPETIRAHCQRHLERYLIPREIQIRSALPRTVAGKVDHQALASEGGEVARHGKDRQ